MSEQLMVLLTSRVPPTRDGVGDYTYCLGKELSKRHSVHIVTTQGQRAENCDRFRVLPIVARWDMWGMRRLWEVLKTLRPTVINVQWVPFLWGRWGINFALPLTVLGLRLAGHRVVTTVHETYVSFNTLGSFFYGPLQRLELWLMILGSAKVVATSSVFLQVLQHTFPWRRQDIFWFPVGSNIPKVPVSAAERNRLRQQLGLRTQGIVLAVFSPLGAGKMIELVYKAWWHIRRRHETARLLILGCHLEEVRQRCPLATADSRVLYTGYLDAAVVSQFLSCADLFLAPFAGGVSARRGSVIAAMEHGLPIVTTRGHMTDPELFDSAPLVLVDVCDENGFVAACAELAADERARISLRNAVGRFFQSHFSWPLIADRLLNICVNDRPLNAR